MRNFFILFKVENFVCCFNTVHNRHLNIHEEQVVVIVSAFFKRFKTIVCNIDCNAMVFKDTFDQFLVDDVVFGNKDFCIKLCCLCLYRLFNNLRCCTRGTCQYGFEFCQCYRFKDNIVLVDTHCIDLGTAGNIGNNDQF